MKRASWMLMVGLVTLGGGCEKTEGVESTPRGAGLSPQTTTAATFTNTETTATNAMEAGHAPNPLPNVAAGPKPPFESVVFRDTGKKNEKGWPKYEATNTGDKPVVFMSVWAYAYDKDGKQLARSRVPLAWNGKIAPGETYDAAVDMGNAEKAPEGATTFQLCYDAIKFEGDTRMLDDSKRCPEKRPLLATK